MQRYNSIAVSQFNQIKQGAPAEGLPPAEGEALLSELYAKMYSTPEYTCRFRWTDGAVALWDNRSCQHYACGDFWPQQRKMERVTVLDAVAEHRTPY